MKTPKKKRKSLIWRVIQWLDSIHIGVGKERDFFIENLSMLVASGMPILSAIHAVTEDVRSRAMKKIIDVFAQDIESGSPLWKAFCRTGIFRDHTIALIRVGEESGTLGDNLKLIALQEAKDRSLRSKIRSAMMYPILVLVLTAVIGIGVAWFILPRLSVVFSQLRIELPSITKGLIATGTFLGAYGVIVIPLFCVVLGLVLYFIFFNPRTKHFGQTLLFAFPGVNRLLREVELARFGYLLGTLLRAGLPVTQAMDSLCNATQFLQYKRFYGFLRDSIEEGNSLQKSFAKYKQSQRLLPSTVQQLLISGEQSGNLSSTLLRIGDMFEDKTENTTKNLTVVLEPLLLIIVWIGVVSVAIAVILPIYNLIGGFNADATSY